MKKVFIGVDISKNTLDTALCHAKSKKMIETFQVLNTLKGIDHFIRKIKKQSSLKEVWICFEHTGNYGLLLAHQLDKAQVCYSAVPAVEIQRSQGLIRGKNDTVDAQRIALYAATHVHKLQPSKLPGGPLMKIKHLLTHRDLLVRTATRFKNHLKSLLVSQQVIDLADIIESTRNQITLLTTRVRQLEDLIEELIHQDNDIRRNYELATSVKGVGLLIATHMILYTQNFTSFINPRKFNCYSGLAPFENSSGISIRGKTRTSHWRNKTMKSLLFNGAYSAARFDHQIAKYYQRKIKEGKAKQSVINAVACKIVYRVFAVVKRGEPYINFDY